MSESQDTKEEGSTLAPAPVEPSGSVDIPVSIPPVPPESPSIATPDQSPTPISLAASSPPESQSQDFRARIREAKKKKRESRLEKILAYARAKEKITNDEIQKLLRVSDATATRYAEELIRRGFLRKAGRMKSTRYEPIA